jgi:hypothetical protein
MPYPPALRAITRRSVNRYRTGTLFPALQPLKLSQRNGIVSRQVFGVIGVELGKYQGGTFQR